MARFSQPRSAFGPEALAQLTPIFDDVWKELVSEGVLETSTFDEESTRTRSAYKALTFASTDWTEIQMRQLLLRTFRNEAARRQRAKSLGRPDPPRESPKPGTPNPIAG
jgi:hypothetical protein